MNDLKRDGKAYKFGDNISTDHIIPGRYYHLRSNLPELAKHLMEDADPKFTQNMKEGDFIAGGRNFGCGSSREHAPLIMKIRGVKAVLAKSFARIFYRNAINIGLPAIECDTGKINEGDELELNMDRGIILDKTTGEEITFKALSPLMQKILDEGGVVNYVKKYKDLPT